MVKSAVLYQLDVSNKGTKGHFEEKCVPIEDQVVRLPVIVMVVILVAMITSIG